jgi:predicted neutral ceramidase superfamily lipid hydrolase
MLLFSVGSLGIALLAGAKLVYDIFDVGLINSLDGLAIKAIVVGIAYLVGWVTALLAIRVYGNLVLPFIINLFLWGCLIAVCTLYLLILQRLYNQQYDMLRYTAYIVIMAAALVAMVGLHLILEGHNLRPLSIPLLIINLLQLGLIVFRYVFTPDANSVFLLNDLLFFGGMAAFSIFMLAHIGLLAPVRSRLANYFDRNSRAIRTED